MYSHRMTYRSGFTLLEAMLVLGILSILTVSVLMFVRPTEQLAKAKNAQRSVDVSTILNGLHQYAVDHAGRFPACVTSGVQNICVTNDCSGVVNGCSLHPLVGAYLVAIPVDPGGSSGNDSKYAVQQREDGRITVFASAAERDENISVTK